MGEQILARGQGASPGRATGFVAFSAESALGMVELGRKAILIRMETTVEDLPALKVVAAVVTTRGGITGDAAIVARALGKPCLVGCSDVIVRYDEKRLFAGDFVLEEGREVTVDGSSGALLAETSHLKLLVDA